MGAPDVVVVTTCAVTPPTLMVFASCCAFSAVSSAANETVNPDVEGCTTGGAGVVSGVIGAGEVLEAVELAARESVVSPGNVTGWSRPCARGRKPSHAKKYQNSLAPPTTVDLTAVSFSGSSSLTSFSPSSASSPSGVIVGRSLDQRVGTAPTSLLVPIATIQAESAFGKRAMRYRPNGSMRRSAGGWGSVTPTSTLPE